MVRFVQFKMLLFSVIGNSQQHFQYCSEFIWEQWKLLNLVCPIQNAALPSSRRHCNNISKHCCGFHMGTKEACMIRFVQFEYNYYAQFQAYIHNCNKCTREMIQDSVISPVQCRNKISYIMQ